MGADSPVGRGSNAWSRNRGRRRTVTERRPVGGVARRDDSPVRHVPRGLAARSRSARPVTRRGAKPAAPGPPKTSREGEEGEGGLHVDRCLWSGYMGARLHITRGWSEQACLPATKRARRRRALGWRVDFLASLSHAQRGLAIINRLERWPGSGDQSMPRAVDFVRAAESKVNHHERAERASVRGWRCSKGCRCMVRGFAATAHQAADEVFALRTAGDRR